MNATKTIDFEPASPGTRVRVFTTLVLVALGIDVVVCTWLAARGPAHATGPLILAATAVPAIGVVTGLAARIRRLSITSDEVLVVRPLYTAHFPLSGLISAAVDRTAFVGARKRIGNDGFGAITGRFRSKKLGSFRACITDVDHAVILRTAEKCLVVSPARTAEFVVAVLDRSRTATKAT